MSMKVLGPNHVVGVLNAPYGHELVVHVRDAANKPVKDNTVSFTSQPPEAIEFAGGQTYALVQTDAQGRAAVRITPRLIGGPHRVLAEASDNHGRAEFTIEVNTAGGARVQQAGGAIVIDTRDGNGHRPVHLPAWPIAAMVIAALVIGGALLLFGRDGGGKTQPPVVVRPGPSSTVDATARAEAQAARAAVDHTATELRGELDSGLAANSAHDRGYGREYGRPTLRLALENARRIAAGRGDLTADGKPPICLRDPHLAACRE